MIIEALLISITGLSLLVLIGSYILYPIVLHFLIPKPEKSSLTSISSKVYLIIPCFNEEETIAQKLENTLSLNLPFELTTIVVSDSSSDNTDSIVEEFSKNHSSIKFINKTQRKGKNDSINLVFDRCDFEPGDIIFFTDANTFFDSDSLKKIVEMINKGYDCVGGSMVYASATSNVAKSEGLYWKYEEWIRKNESKLNKNIVLNGGLFAMRAKSFERLLPYVPNDFEAPLRICGTGGNVSFCKDAKGYEAPVDSSVEEFSRKLRMANRQFNCIKTLWNRLSFFTKIQVSLHKIIRWFGLQLFLLQYLLLGILLLYGYYSLFVVESIIVLLMGISIIFNKIKPLTAVYHAVMVHHNAFIGASRAIRGIRISKWMSSQTNRR